MCRLLLCVNVLKHSLKHKFKSSRYIFCNVSVIFSSFYQFSYFLYLFCCIWKVWRCPVNDRWHTSTVKRWYNFSKINCAYFSLHLVRSYLDNQIFLAFFFLLYFFVCFRDIICPVLCCCGRCSFSSSSSTYSISMSVASCSGSGLFSESISLTTFFIYFFWLFFHKNCHCFFCCFFLLLLLLLLLTF